LKAQASRGVDFKESKFREKITQIISLLIPMFVIAYKRAGDLAEAMEARGYVPNSERTSINELRLKLSDYTVISVMILFLSGVITILATGLYAI
jgi:energy-coupling factor transport system permease protein